MWCRPIGLEQSTGLDTGGGIQGRQVCQVRMSEQEDEAGVSQVTAKHGHMLISKAAARAVLTGALPTDGILIGRAPTGNEYGRLKQRRVRRAKSVKT